MARWEEIHRELAEWEVAWAWTIHTTEWVEERRRVEGREACAVDK